MKNVKFLRTIYWILMVILIMVFWYSLRYAGDQAMMYSFIALGIWGVTFALNRYIKSIDK